jgi:hypothetical protein
VNEHGGFGKWQWAVSKNPADVKGIIEKVCKAQRQRGNVSIHGKKLKS